MKTDYRLKQRSTWKLLLMLCLSGFSFFESKSQTSTSEYATVYFIRDKDLIESATVMTIKINDSITVKLKNNSYQKMLLNSPSIRISLVKLYLFDGSADTIHLHPGQSYYFKYFREQDPNNLVVYRTLLRQVSDKVALNSIKLIDLNAEQKTSDAEPDYVKVEKNTFSKVRPLSPDSSYIYFIRPNALYGSAIPFKIALSDSFAFLLPNNTSYAHATADAEIDIVTHMKNNNIQNGTLHIALEKGKAYYVLIKYSSENGMGATLIRMEQISKEMYLEKVAQGTK